MLHRRVHYLQTDMLSRPLPGRTLLLMGGGRTSFGVPPPDNPMKNFTYARADAFGSSIPRRFARSSTAILITRCGMSGPTIPTAAAIRNSVLYCGSFHRLTILRPDILSLLFNSISLFCPKGTYVVPIVQEVGTIYFQKTEKTSAIRHFYDFSRIIYL